ncbi:DUF4397 domain-containing protein [Rhodocytophaga rosea]|uniref:DUF4397 domain-containing protein n=1 Tax=Rhodocytophaga rosea TaxID=2704465 RepID=A0A6C0GNV5_9BACT|nr:DUF4397 domain-containing protein [Rhodocytophaga rosea]QHT69715.1 DUF4397 domain-containing protein [Rhodocytophaga rosea]
MRFKIVFFLALLIISACSNWKEEPAISKVIFINALPGSNEATLLFDGQPLNTKPLVYDTFTTSYRDIRAGRRMVSVKLSEYSEPSEEDTFYVPEFSYFTAYITKDITQTPEVGRLYFYQDAIIKPAAGKANVRFMNLYPDKTAEIDLMVSGRTDALFTKQTFGKITAFVSTDTSSYYTFRLRQKGVVIPNTVYNLKITRQNNYTILLTDSLGNATGEKKPRLQLITHQQ